MDDTAVMNATGKALGDWFAILDGRDARELPHKEQAPSPRRRRLLEGVLAATSRRTLRAGPGQREVPRWPWT